jgi:hypothetical protein
VVEVVEVPQVFQLLHTQVVGQQLMQVLLELVDKRREVVLVVLVELIVVEAVVVLDNLEVVDMMHMVVMAVRELLLSDIGINNVKVIR